MFHSARFFHVNLTTSPLLLIYGQISVIGISDGLFRNSDSDSGRLHFISTRTDFAAHRGIDFRLGRGASSSRREDQLEAEELSISGRGSESVQVEECLVASPPESTLKLADGSERFAVLALRRECRSRPGWN
jgi:hypothetical protein